MSEFRTGCFLSWLFPAEAGTPNSRSSTALLSGRWRRKMVLLGGLLIGSLAQGRVQADDKREAAPAFQKDVLPIFEEKCLRCHGGKRRGGKLDMRTLEAMLTGGDTGPAIKQGNADKSLLIELIHHQEMPPKKEKSVVTSSELDLLRRWIDSMPGKNPTRG
ncbi:MAG: c-type cytochrome domain-containing protein [Prosthecobacter sp.]|nr:c-type cytochrome domain-containing protein [Prosthecobacter sp.]